MRQRTCAGARKKNNYCNFLYVLNIDIQYRIERIRRFVRYRSSTMKRILQN